jgi:hypothetical protein
MAASYRLPSPPGPAGLSPAARLRRISCSRSTLKIPDPDDARDIPTCTEAVPMCAEPVLTMGSTATPALTIRSSRVRLRLVARDTHRPANPSFSRELHAITRGCGHTRRGTVGLRVIVTSSPPSWLCSQPRCMGVPGEGEGIRLVGHRSPPGRNAGPITVIVSAYLEPRAHAVTSERGRCRYWGPLSDYLVSGLFCRVARVVRPVRLPRS